MLMKCNANISIPGAMRNANEMQMKCNANKCKKMHNSGSDPIGTYPFAACVALVLQIFTVFCDNLHSQKQFPLGSVMRQWLESCCFHFFSGVLLILSS